MTRITKHGAVLGAIVVASFIAGCAAPSQVTSPADGGASSESAAAQADDILSALRDQIDGTPAQRDAGEMLVQVEIQGAIRDCMRRYNIDYPLPAWDGLKAGPNAGISVGGMLAFAPVGLGTYGIADAFAERQLRVSKQQDPFAGLSETDKGRLSDVLAECNSAGNQFQADNFPVGYDELEGALGGVLGEAEQTADVATALADYPGCMKGSGFDVSELSDPAALVNAKLAAVPADEANVAGDPSWQNASSLERAIAQADTSCRSSIRELALVEALPALRTFAADHAEQLQALSQGWADLASKSAARIQSSG